MLRVEGIGFYYDPRTWLFRDLSYDFQQGSTTAIVGPSGSGKTTFLALLAGFEAPREGAITSDIGSRLAWIFQSPSLISRRSVLANVSLPLLAGGATRNAAHLEARRLLDLVDVGKLEAATPRAISGGEAQRVCLARALAADPDLILADEPTAGLDRETAGVVFDAFTSARKRNVTTVIATHDRRLARICDHVLELG